ncbi:hypothetical protein V6N13_146681 [Hibiscus sabdariffa]|uniref:FAE domain-containing protein n=1 Tax=Hibiscus sabdariffa TaxID=183260 RepID=A0ABR2TTN2_9ROSI
MGKTWKRQKLKYVKLGYGYSYNPAMVLVFALIIPLSIATLVQFTGLKWDWVSELWANQALRFEGVNAATRLARSLVVSRSVTILEEWGATQTLSRIQIVICYCPCCIFRIGGAAVLLSNKARDKGGSKYQLVQLTRTHKGTDDKHYNCVFQREDEKGTIGVSLLVN